MNGKITVISNDCGTTFEIFLPVENIENQAGKPFKCEK